MEGLFESKFYPFLQHPPPTQVCERPNLGNFYYVGSTDNVTNSSSKFEFTICPNFPQKVGFATLPWKRSKPVWRSLTKKRNGWSAMKICRAADLVPITREVAAAAVVPTSSTSMKAFWIAFVTTRFSSEMPPKSAAVSSNMSVIPRLFRPHSDGSLSQS